MINWRTVLEPAPEAALIDTRDYAADLDAVDRAIRQTVEAHGKPQIISPEGWGDRIIIDSKVVGVESRALAPVRSSDSGRTAVALTQMLYLFRKWDFVDSHPIYEFGPIYVAIAMADHLLARKLKLTAETARDLVAVVNAPPLTSKHQRSYEYLVKILKQLENSFSPPVPSIVEASLRSLLANLETPFVQNPWKGKRSAKPTVPLRFKNASLRIRRLICGD